MAITEIEDRKTTGPNTPGDISLQLGRCLKATFQHSVIETLVLLVSVGLVFWLLSASDSFIGTKLALLILNLAILLSHCYQMLRNQRCKDLVLKQLDLAAKDRAKTNRLYDLSILDPLTALHNRRFGEQSLKEAVERAHKTGENLAIVLLDLDYFKEINDQFGHAVGDVALKEFSRSIRKAIRACDTPVRLGGDEFLLVLPECPRDKVTVILQRIGTPAFYHEGIKINVCYSSGSAHYQYGDASETLLARADEQLYAKKAARTSTPPKAPIRLISEPAIKAPRSLEPSWRRS